jgi:hypothetical protein
MPRRGVVTESQWLVRLRVAVTGFAVVYLVIRAPHMWDIALLADTAPTRWEPVGPLALWAEPWDPTVVRILLIATIAAGIAATAGRWWRVTGPTVAVGVLLLTSIRSSWGQIFHTENLLVLDLLILAAAAVADGRHPGRRSKELPAQAMLVVLVVTYVLAGVAKLRIGGIGWLSGEALANQVAHDNLRKVLVGDWYSPFGAWALAHEWIFGPLAVASLAVELGAPLVLLGGRIRTAWVASAWLFHLGVFALMAIMFPYPLSGVAFVCCWAARPLRRSSSSP